MGARACGDARCGLCGPLDSGSALPWERHSVGEREKEGKVGAVGKGPTRLCLPCRTCMAQITYAMGSARKEKGDEVKRRKSKGEKQQSESVARSMFGVHSKLRSSYCAVRDGLPWWPWWQWWPWWRLPCSFAFVHDDPLMMESYS